MRNWSTKQDDKSTYSAEEFNDLALELENTCLSTGEKLFVGGQHDRDTNLNQLQATIMKLASAGFLLVDNGVRNNIKLESPNNFNFSSKIIDNQVFKFIGKYTNSTGITMSAYGSATVPLNNINGQELVAGDISSGSVYEIKSHFKNGILNSFILLSRQSTDKGIVFEYGDTDSYSVNDMCIVNGLLYTSLIDNNQGYYPPTHPKRWKLYKNIYTWSNKVYSHYKVGDLFLVDDKLKVLKQGGSNSVDPKTDNNIHYHTIMYSTALDKYYTKPQADASFYARPYIDSLLQKKNAGTGNFVILDGSVTNPKLALNSVTSDKIGDRQVTHPKIASSAVQGNNIKYRSLSHLKFAQNSITGSQIESDSLTTSELGTGCASYRKLQVNSAIYGKFASNSVTTSNIQDNTIPASKITANSMGSREVRDGAVSAVELVASSVGDSQLRSHEVSASKLAGGSVITSTFQNRSVTHEKLAYGVPSGLESTFINGNIFHSTAKFNGSKILNVGNTSINMAYWYSMMLIKMTSYVYAQPQPPSFNAQNAIISVVVNEAEVWKGRLQYIKDGYATGDSVNNQPAGTIHMYEEQICIVVPPGGNIRFTQSGYTLTWRDPRTQVNGLVFQ